MYFQYNNVIYHQKQSVAMGSPLSSVITDLVMGECKVHTLLNMKQHCIFLKRYIDDTLSLIHKDRTHIMLNHLNSFHQLIQFTLEMENDKQEIPFLDLRIIRYDEELLFDLYKKGKHLLYILVRTHIKIHTKNKTFRWSCF